MEPVQVEPVADEELVGDREADVAERQVLDEAAVRAVEERADGEARRVAEPESRQEVVEGQAGVDDQVDDHYVPAGDRRVEVLHDPDACMAPERAPVAREAHEVEVMQDRHGAGEVREKDVGRPEYPDQERLLTRVILADAGSELGDAGLDIRSREVHFADAGVGPGQPQVSGGSTRRG